MRIIAGSWRGRPLLGPEGKSTRPILDRVKASVFDILGSRYGVPGQLPPLSVLDLFCGTGSMGLEALSRGAAHCTFLDRDRSAIRRLQFNIRSLNTSDRTTVLAGDVLAPKLLPADLPAWALVFVDPPFAESRHSGPAGLVATLLRRLDASGRTTPDVLIVCRHEAKFPLDPELESYRQVDCRRYGRMAISFYQPARHLDAAEPSA